MDLIKINDISPLFMEQILTADRPTRMVWYRPEDIYEVDTDRINDHTLELLDNIFDVSGFPEYLPISHAVMNYMIDNIFDENLDEQSALDVVVMVHESSIFGKNHDSCFDSGFTGLFTLRFDDGELNGVRINFKLVTEKIELSDGHAKYPTVIENEIYETDPDKDECSICLSTADPMIETDCHHKFHLDCLRCTPQFLCPMCKTDVRNFLKNNSISEDEITERLSNQQMDDEFTDYCAMVSMLNLNNIILPDMIRLCHESLRLNRGNVTPYMDLLFDMNANASRLFNQISKIRSKSEPGVFIYEYSSVTELIMQMVTKNTKSMVKWKPLSSFEGTCLYDGIKERMDEIKHPSSEYLVIALIENVADGTIIHKNNYKHPHCKRRSYQDILHSMLYCTRCICSSPSKNTPNAEQKWAKRTLTKLKKKLRKQKNKSKKNYGMS